MSALQAVQRLAGAVIRSAHGMGQGQEVPSLAAALAARMAQGARAGEGLPSLHKPHLAAGARPHGLEPLQRHWQYAGAGGV